MGIIQVTVNTKALFREIEFFKEWLKKAKNPKTQRKLFIKLCKEVLRTEKEKELFAKRLLNNSYLTIRVPKIKKDPAPDAADQIKDMQDQFNNSFNYAITKVGDAAAKDAATVADGLAKIGTEAAKKLNDNVFSLVSEKVYNDIHKSITDAAKGDVVPASTEKGAAASAAFKDILNTINNYDASDKVPDAETAAANIKKACRDIL